MLTDHALYYRHPVRPQTPEAAVKKFKRTHRMIYCFPRGCQMSLAGCRKLKKKSAQVKQFVQACRISTVTPAFHEALKCIECRRTP